MLLHHLNLNHIFLVVHSVWLNFVETSRKFFCKKLNKSWVSEHRNISIESKVLEKNCCAKAIYFSSAVQSIQSINPSIHPIQSNPILIQSNPYPYLPKKSFVAYQKCALKPKISEVLSVLQSFNYFSKFSSKFLEKKTIHKSFFLLLHVVICK